MDNTKIIEKLKEAFLDKNIECDGANCIGCWKDIVREAIKMLEAQPSQVEGLPKDEMIKNEAEEVFPEFPDTGMGHTETDSFFDHKVEGFIMGSNWMRGKASAIIARERPEKEELETKLNLSGIDNENLRIEIQFLKKGNEQLKSKTQ